MLRSSARGAVALLWFTGVGTATAQHGGVRTASVVGADTGTISGTLSSTTSAPLVLVLTTTTSSVVALSEEWREVSSTTSTIAELADFEPPASAKSARLRLVYTGASGGIGSGRYDFDLIWRLQAALQTKKDSRVERVHAHHGTLVQGLHTLISSDYTVSGLLTFLKQSHIRCGDPRPAISLRSPLDRGIMLGGTTPSWAFALGGTITRGSFVIRECTGEAASAAFLYSPKSQRSNMPVWSIDRFEFRLALHVDLIDGGRPRRMEIVGIPKHEGARRFQLLSALVRASKDNIYLDAGSFVDGSSSIKDGELSLHRPLTYGMLTSLSPAGFTPGDNELVAGAKQFLEEVRQSGVKAVATNWKSETLPLPSHQLRTVETELGPLKIAIFGLVDPRIAARTPKLKAEGVSIEPPAAALQGAINDLRGKVDLTIVLADLSDEDLRAVSERVEGLDLVIGGRHGESDRLRRATLAVTPSRSGGRVAAAILPIDAIGVASLEVTRIGDRFALRKIEHEPHRMSERVPPDPTLLARISRTRAEVYPQFDLPLLPSPGGPLDMYAPAVWNALVCEAVRSYSGADVVLLPDVPKGRDIPGPLTELLVADRLAVFDRLEQHWVPGDRLRDLLLEAPKTITTGCGGQIGLKTPLVMGRPIELDRIYRVVSTDRARVGGLDTLLATAYTKRFFDPTQAKPVTDSRGAQVSLRAAVLQVLRDLRAKDAVETLSTPSATNKRTIVVWRVSRLSARLEKFRGAEDPAFSEVKETKATNPSSLLIGLEADSALIVDGPDLSSDLRIRASYNLVAVQDVESQETADDLRFSTSTALPMLGTKIGPALVMPYGEVLLDTEFTPSEAGRQLDLFFTLGLSASGGVVNRLRAGAFASRDLRETDRPTEVGGRAEFEATVPLGYELRFVTLFDGTLFGATDRDDESDLRFKTLLEGRLALPLSRAFDLALFAQVFGFQGRVPQTEQVRASYTLGFALDVKGAFRL